MRPRVAAAAAAAAVLLAACQGNPAHRQPVAPDDGLQLSGRIGDRQFHITDGEPEVELGPCDGDGESLCIESFTINGDPLTLVVVNPEVLGEGVTREVVAHCFGDPCAQLALVDVVLGGDRTSAEGGELVVVAAGPRFAATFNLRMVGGGVVTGRFNVLPVPRPPATP